MQNWFIQCCFFGPQFHFSFGCVFICLSLFSVNFKIRKHFWLLQFTFQSNRIDANSPSIPSHTSIQPRVCRCLSDGLVWLPLIATLQIYTNLPGAWNPHYSCMRSHTNPHCTNTHTHSHVTTCTRTKTNTQLNHM